MSLYKSGVHTIEVQTTSQARLAMLPNEYKHAVTIEGNNRYRVNIPRLPGMQEYNSTAATEDAISAACHQLETAEGQTATVTRIDYRLDNHIEPYVKNLSLMRLLVYTLAYKYGTWSRIWETTQRIGGMPLSVRAMPNEEKMTVDNADGHSIQRGIEYYNKLMESGTDAFGQARLELRRLNLHGERLSYVLKQWRQELAGISKPDYLNMLEAHVIEDLQPLMNDRGNVGSIKHLLIAKEEPGLILRLTGKNRQSASRYSYLPDWKKLQDHIGGIMDEV